MSIQSGKHKRAEAAKVIENLKRYQYCFYEELSIIFNKLGIDTKTVLETASTKWNFLRFHPGLVGGHCIGVDPYYLTYKAEQIGYHSQIILAGRKINDYMAKYVAENTVKYLIKADKQIKGSRVAIMGITFKENCPDVRNTKVIDIIKELGEYGIEVMVVDPIADAVEVREQYNIRLSKMQDLRNLDAIVFAVAHDEFKTIKLENLKNLYNNYEEQNIDAFEEIAAAREVEDNNYNMKHVLIDIKGIFSRKEAEKLNYLYWRL